MEALRQLGRMLDKSDRAKGTAGAGRPKKGGATRSLPKSETPTLAELGLNKKTSALAQKIAKLPDEQFEAVKHRVVKRHGTPFCSFRAWRRDFSALRLPLASLFCSRLCLWWGKKRSYHKALHLYQQWHCQPEHLAC